MPLRGSSSDEANWNAEGMARVREWEEARPRWRSWRLHTTREELKPAVYARNATIIFVLDYLIFSTYS